MAGCSQGRQDLAVPHLDVLDIRQVNWAALQAAGFQGCVFDKVRFHLREGSRGTGGWGAVGLGYAAAVASNPAAASPHWPRLSTRAGQHADAAVRAGGSPAAARQSR
jgi:hypothetical protein